MPRRDGARITETARHRAALWYPRCKMLTAAHPTGRRRRWKEERVLLRAMSTTLPEDNLQFYAFWKVDNPNGLLQMDQDQNLT